ncbi:pre-mRNA-splicing factor SYF1-like [Salvia divinorum]|uniref:Pre-mRNA-splicing factor SYF1-like n=1 Tax=Salvia divinorum TaxID=28513 RepID=A0ABD1HNC9_SALDI
MPICEDDLYPAEEDYPYKEEVLRNPHNLKSWCRYLTHAPPRKRVIIYERALKALPGSYKLWRAYLRLRLDVAHSLPITHPRYQTLNNTFERALATMHKMPRIWIMFLQSLTHQKLITRTRRAFDRPLRALPVTQHASVWECYVAFASQKLVPLKTSLAVYNRLLKYDPSYIENYIEFLVNSELWKEAAERLAEALNDDQFVSRKGKTRHGMWLELCDLLIHHSTEIHGLDVDAVIRGGIRKFTDEAGMLWTCLATHYIKRGHLEKARDAYEEGMATVTTVRDFSVVFDAYSQFEESVLSIKMGDMEDDIDDEEAFWFKDDNDMDMLMERYAHLIHRSSELANCVQLRQNPHNDIWVAYLSKFVKRYGKSKLERARELFEEAIEKAPAQSVKPLYLEYAKMEEDYGLATRAMRVYDEATKAVPPNEKLGMYEIYMARAGAAFGLAKTREIYEQAINESGLSNKDVKAMCLRYAQVEEKLGEIDRGRALYKHASQFADPRCDHECLWNEWHEFEVQHGSEDTCLEMIRIKRSVRARYSQILPEQTSLDKTKEDDDEMERRLTSNDFVSAGLQHNGEDVERPPQEDEEIHVAAVFGGGLDLARKRDEATDDAQNNGALERIKRMRRS